jgi:RNAse (barnase) inhibitor barstar
MLHRELAGLLGLFDGYGRNLDALWDVLEDDDLRRVKGGVEIVWRDASTFARSHPDYFIKVQRLFAESAQPISLLIAV